MIDDEEDFAHADLVVAKGMACYETLIEHPEKTGGKVALLYQAKCIPVARHSGVTVGDLVAKLV